jgi:hypothetical protein
MIEQNKYMYKKSIIALSFLVLSFAGCSKGGDSPSPTPPTPTPPPVVIAESDLVFRVDVAGSEVNYSTVFPVVGASLVMNANITSTLPKDGVTIDVSVKKKSDNTVVFATNLSSSAASNPVTVTGLAAGTLCVATVTVTSKSKATNTALKTFELASK